MTIYKYHINLFHLYQKMGDSAWCSSEIENIISPTAHSYLHQKGLLKTVKRPIAEEKRESIKKWRKANWQFHIFTLKGLEIAQYLVKNPNLMAKKLLSDLSKGRSF